MEIRSEKILLLQIRYFAKEERIRFHAKTVSEMTVTCGEDTWIISLEDGKGKLWHNDYVRISPKERYITQGFRQKKIKKAPLKFFRPAQQREISAADFLKRVLFMP